MKCAMYIQDHFQLRFLILREAQFSDKLSLSEVKSLFNESAYLFPTQHMNLRKTQIARRYVLFDAVFYAV